MHGTLEMTLLAWKFNSKKLLCKTLNSRMNIRETRPVLNIVKTDGKWSPEGKWECLELSWRCFKRNFEFQATLYKLNSSEISSVVKNTVVKCATPFWSTHRNNDHRQTNIQILPALWFVLVTPSQAPLKKGGSNFVDFQLRIN